MSRPLYVLGVSAFYHDSAAALLRDGEIVAAAQEERFTRKKHDPRFPAHAINACLEAAQIEADELAAVVFYENPVLSLDRIVRTVAAAGEAALPAWLEGMPGWLSTKLFFEELLRRFPDYRVGEARYLISPWARALATLPVEL